MLQLHLFLGQFLLLEFNLKFLLLPHFLRSLQFLIQHKHLWSIIPQYIRNTYRNRIVPHNDRVYVPNCVKSDDKTEKSLFVALIDTGEEIVVTPPT